MKGNKLLVSLLSVVAVVAAIAVPVMADEDTEFAEVTDNVVA